MSSAHHHPVFARIYPLLARAGERVEGEHRFRMLAGLRGRVVEVGAGHGVNFHRYPPEVTEVVAIEPEPHLREKATAATARAAVPITVRDGTADALGEEDDSVDAVVFSLVLCSVPDQATALAEAERVLRPNGELRFFEHVVSEHPKAAAWQRRVQPVWGRMAAGCCLHRDTVAAIRAAGFDLTELDRFDVKGAGLAKPHIRGAARMPA